MPRLISLQFAQEEMPLVYDPGPVASLQPQEFVVAQRESEEDVGFVAGIEYVSTEQLKLRPVPHPRIVRRASDGEKDAFFLRRADERKALALCKDKTRELKLPIKITAARISARDGRIIFHFTSDQRVDFRALVREMAAILSRRVELWQIGVRDEARMVDGFGVCGLRTCCSQWLTEFRPISIRMAKEQDIHMPPSKLSGQCGRLLCCLSYEVDQYKEMGKELKPKGATITVDGEQGVILDRNVLLGAYTVQMAGGNIATVTEEQLSNIRTPDQMKRMARVMRGETVEAEPPVTEEAPAQRRDRSGERSEEEEAKRSGKKRRSRRSRRNKGDEPKAREPRREDAAPPEKRGGDNDGEAGGRRSGRRRRSRRSKGKAGDGQPKQDNNQQQQGGGGADGEKKPGGRRKKRRRRGGGGSREGGGGGGSGES